jgi:2-hydroxy-3-keto-5-methylthiopentenyl-1-phosphate phosphatase
MPHIALVWDFDGTLSPVDSTTKTVEFFQEQTKGGEFWSYIKSLRGDKELPTWEHILASDAPIWMYSLSRLAFNKKAPLNAEFFKNFIVPLVPLYPHALECLQKIKALEKQSEFQKLRLEIHHFIVSAGLKELIEQLFPKDLIAWTFGCRYKIVAFAGNESEPESVPVFCMDETMKTRSLFEISKGSFKDPEKSVNSRVDKKDLWAPFENMVYIGDGETDIPALSLTRKTGGLGVAVYDPGLPKEKIAIRFKKMRFDKRTDLITPADFSDGSELYNYLALRCNQIRQRYEAEAIV